jgi:hypothetical protein
MDNFPDSGFSFQKEGTGNIAPKTEMHDPIREARSLASHLLKQKFHPVLIFGTSASGKTLLLSSLLNFGIHSHKPGLKAEFLGPENADEIPSPAVSAFPDGYENKRDREKSAHKFIYGTLKDFNNGKAPGQTQTDTPFLIPIRTVVDSPLDSPIQTKYAFLEGMGEGYEFHQTKENTEYLGFRPEIEAILQYFTNPISVIFVVPCDVSILMHQRKTGTATDHSYECLAACMERYTRIRMHGSDDNLLFLVSKWDMQSSPRDGNGYFSNVPGKTIASVIKKWPYAWPAFSKLPNSEKNASRKALMPHSAGQILGDAPNKQVIHDTADQQIYDNFNRTLWNWLHGNANQVTFDDLPTIKPVLYPDIVPPGPLSLNFYWKCIEFLLHLKQTTS